MHHTIWVAGEDFNKDLDRLFSAMDQPTTDGVNSYFVCMAAARAGLKVAVSGLGGDELFGSYPSFEQVPRMVSLFGPFAGMPFLGKTFRAISSQVLKHFTSPKYAGLLEYGGSYGGAYLLRRSMYMPWELPGILDGEMVKEGWQELQTLVRLEETVAGIRNEHMKVSTLEMTWYMKNQLLRDTDWASMAHSLEVRVPFLDIEFLKTIALEMGNSCSPTKQDMASTPLRPLPPEVLKRGKTGFSIPIKEWLLRNSNSGPKRGVRGWARKVYDVNLGKKEYSA
jgi:asparagine synthase (glutamine-hydrolysing)